MTQSRYAAKILRFLLISQIFLIFRYDVGEDFYEYFRNSYSKLGVSNNQLPGCVCDGVVDIVRVGEVTNLVEIEPLISKISFDS